MIQSSVDNTNSLSSSAACVADDCINFEFPDIAQLTFAPVRTAQPFEQPELERGAVLALVDLFRRSKGRSLHDESDGECVDVERVLRRRTE